jgi:hypothetical protein
VRVALLDTRRDALNAAAELEELTAALKQKLGL